MGWARIHEAEVGGIIRYFVPPACSQTLSEQDESFAASRANDEPRHIPCHLVAHYVISVQRAPSLIRAQQTLQLEARPNDKSRYFAISSLELDYMKDSLSAIWEAAIPSSAGNYREPREEEE
jgi:hypothetical protein